MRRGHLARTRFEWINLQADGTLSQADGWDRWVCPYTRAKIVAVLAAVEDAGGTSGSTDFMLARVRAETAVDILSSTLDIENDTTTARAKAAKSLLQNNNLQWGDIIRLDINAVPGTASTDGAVAFLVEIQDDKE